jgi:copper(I)-binding protein
VSWRRLPGAARTGAALAGACVTVLVLLTAYTATGAAGDPPARIQVSGGRVFVPLGASSTSAFFDIANTGGSDDVLQFVSADSLDGAMLSRSVTNNGAGHMRPVGDIAVRAGGRLRMTPFGTDIMIQDPPRLKVGERITFDLWFRWSGRVRATAVVVPVGW